MANSGLDPGLEKVPFGDGRHASWYTLPFDREGRCSGEEHRDGAVSEAKSGSISDVFVFSHGWNNDWKAVRERYGSFVAGFRQMHAEGHGLRVAEDYHPLLIGIFWPSVILVMPKERAPRIAAAVDDAELAELASALPPEARARLTELLGSSSLDLDQARALAEVVVPLFAVDEDDAPESLSPPTPDELLASWRKLATDEPASSSAPAGTVSEEWIGEPQAAAFSLNPRKLARLLTVRPMKDRAGVVGARGVGPLLRELLASSDARVHMIGHSYGSKVCLSAICEETLPGEHRVDSLLLLQPAVNHRCFAADAGGGMPGGYRAALDRVRQPIMTTYSAHDDALRKWFHHALTRRADLGEAAMAGLPGPPSQYAALGGYGPRGAEAETENVGMLDPGARYQPQRQGTRLLAVDGTRGIGDHGDISNSYTWWALYDQVAQR